MLGKIATGVLIIFLFLGAFHEPIMDGIKGWRTVDTTEVFLVETAAGVTTANVTLGSDLYQAATAEIISITSTDVDDTPVGTAYAEATKVLTVAGLECDTSRSLSINYLAESEQGVMRAMGPFLGIFIFLFIVGGTIWGIFRKRRRR